MDTYLSTGHFSAVANRTNIYLQQDTEDILMDINTSRLTFTNKIIDLSPAKSRFRHEAPT
jgi:hypothetical protein